MKTQINEIKRMQLLAGVINESQLNEGWDDFNATGWTARIKEIAEEMGYKVSTGYNDNNVTRGALQAEKEYEKGEKTAYIGTIDNDTEIVATFTLTKGEEEKNRLDIQKKIADIYKNDADVKVTGDNFMKGTAVQVSIKEKSGNQLQQESFDKLDEIVDKVLEKLRKK